MNVRVQLFAVAKELAGSDSVEVSVDDQATVSQLRTALGERLPALAATLRLCLVAVNAEFAADAQPLHPGDVVALLPPLSGG